MKIALAQINPSMGAVRKNAEKISRFLKEAREKGADLTIFPELALVGYPPRDFLTQEGFVEDSNAVLQQLIQDHPRQSFILGFVEKTDTVGKGLCNSAAFIHEGRIEGVQRKRLLPTYDVFDENRYFKPGKESHPLFFGKEKIGITICEDIWVDDDTGKKVYETDPAADLGRQGIDLLINVSASPYHDRQIEIRKNLTARLVQRIQKPLIYVNMVGGNDELIFDGGSFALDASGKTTAKAKLFEEDLIFLGDIQTWPEEEVELNARALTLGLKDYVTKCGFKKVVLGLSGGIDSSLVLLLACEALGPKNVVAVSMPSKFTSDMSQNDASEMAEKMGVELFTLPIENAVQAYEKTLAELFAQKPRDTTEENIQARVRGNLLMALSNKFGWLVLSTGNKSELAVGYCTQYGDMAGGLAVIADLPKQKVYQMARHLNRKWNAIPEEVFTRPPTAELRPNQTDQDSLPPYETLDAILELYIEDRMSVMNIVRKGFSREIVERVVEMVDRNEFKRRQAAPGLRISQKAFGMGRRMPIAKGAV